MYNQRHSSLPLLSEVYLYLAFCVLHLNRVASERRQFSSKGFRIMLSYSRMLFRILVLPFCRPHIRKTSVYTSRQRNFSKHPIRGFQTSASLHAFVFILLAIVFERSQVFFSHGPMANMCKTQSDKNIWCIVCVHYVSHTLFTFKNSSPASLSPRITCLLLIKQYVVTCLVNLPINK